MEDGLSKRPAAADESPLALSQPQIRELLARNWIKAQPSLKAFIIASTPQFSDAEDLLQEVAAEVALRFDDYDPSRPFLPWALWVAKIKISDFYRLKQRRQVVFLEESFDALAAACVRAQESMVDERNALDRCLAKLTDRSRKLLHMRYFDDLSPQQIGSVLGMASQSVRVSLSRIRTALSECVLNVIGSTTISDG